MRVFVALTGVAWFVAMLPAQTLPAYTPPQLIRGSVPSVAPTVIGGGEVLIEAIVDQRGAVTRPILLRSTPPFTNALLEAIGGWTFKPAEAVTPDNTVAPVESTVLIAAVYRPPTFANAPTIGEVPRDVGRPSLDVAFPTAVVAPSYPPNALGGSAVMFEVYLSESGQITKARAITSNPGFEDAARDALMQWKFRPSTYRGRPAPAVAYVVFGFPSPVVGPRVVPSGQLPGVSSGR